jgi:SNF2 family DNA or RNA helicase
MTNKSAKSKCVVFSQFVGVLDVAAEEGSEGIGFVRIDGKMKLNSRRSS